MESRGGQRKRILGNKWFPQPQDCVEKPSLYEEVKSLPLGDSLPVCNTQTQVGMKKNVPGTSLVVQWLRLCLPRQGVGVWFPGQGTKILHACVCAKSLQLCLTVCSHMDCSLPGSSVHGILQARIPEWVSMPSSRGSSPPRDRTCVSYISCISRQLLYH